MAETSGEKSYEATPHRRQEARKKGQVATSQDLASATLLIAGVVVLMLLGRTVMEAIARLMVHQLGGAAWLTADVAFFCQQWSLVLAQMAGSLVPIFGLLLLSGLAVGLLQVGFLFVPERVAPDISRVDPLQGLQRLLSLTALMRLGFGLFKVVVIAVVAFLSLYNRWADMLATSEQEPAQIAWLVTDITLWTCLKIGIVLFLLAVLDYGYQRWKYERDLRMTQQEIREEMKDYQGDPQTLARRRAVQRQLVLNRLSNTVPKADVVITNPTELAVAIRYVPAEMAAPVVVAKGAGHLAQRIRRLALEHHIPIVEKKPLAQALYREVDVNQPIPHSAYAAVAEVLAYVYQLKGRQVVLPPGSAA
ncbi:MAG: flagellar biosynthesis protein FlhB [Planctomycetes bacterium RBG_16_64_10]|nr:MAG: flagellar biosynthesis protein FlhB [Planctomycetes bacterium RBG_16_64_10]